jgi:hypothetical protein
MPHAVARELRNDEYREQDRPSRPELRLVEPPRRTVVITGQRAPTRSRRAAAAQQIEARPDRIAQWAFLLGLFMVFVAVSTAAV